ncbi:TlpA family protein disulfide reductase [Streptomyces sp. NPDC020731]|uniref:TlpA family protein disulfide reductase n=1 Tax=Streptomyces sp. NPDC020731 TaxID=3365085 RepID=UPI0037B07BF4
MDLLLTLGVIKRLREHTQQLASRPAGRRDGTALRVGETVGDFRVTARNGRELTPAGLPDGTVVAFFSPTCGPCEEKVPKFAAYARTLPMGERQVVAVVVGDAAAAAPFADLLTPVASVVVEEPDGALNSAFRVQAFPTVLQVGHGRDGGLVVTSEEAGLGIGGSSALPSAA